MRGGQTPFTDRWAVVQYVDAAPPPFPLLAGTNSEVYVPLLLDAAGVVPAAISQELMQRRRCLLPVQLGSGRELEQGTRVGALGRDSEQCSPPCDPGGLRSRSEVCRHGGGTLTGEQAQQHRSLCHKAAADLDADDDEAAATRPRELRVGVASLASGGIVNGPAGLRVGARVGVAGAGDRRDYGGVEGELGPMPQWEAVGDDLDAPPVRDRDLDIHVSDPEPCPHAPGCPYPHGHASRPGTDIGTHVASTGAPGCSGAGSSSFLPRAWFRIGQPVRRALRRASLCAVAKLSSGPFPPPGCLAHCPA